MKKSVVVLIGIIYIASIALVSFYGLKYKVFQEEIYVERLELLNDDIKPAGGRLEGVDYYTTVSPDENGERRYQIKYRVFPDNATDQSVDFHLVPTTSDGEVSGVSIDKNGVVIFDGENVNSVIVQIIAKNASSDDATVSIAIFAYGR